jgi:hypothetical protein
VTARRRPALVRSHVITGGRAAPALNTLDHVTLVTVVEEEHDHQRLCSGGWLSIAEIAAHLGLPSSVVKVLVADLVVSGHLTTGAAAAVPHQGPSADLLRQVLEGLNALV